MVQASTLKHLICFYMTSGKLHEFIDFARGINIQTSSV